MTWPTNVHPDFLWRALAQGRKGSAQIDCADHPGVEFDELFLGRWMHLEAMDRGVWWMSIGGYHIWVRVTKKGKVTVTHHGKELGEYGLERDE